MTSSESQNGPIREEGARSDTPAIEKAPGVPDMELQEHYCRKAWHPGGSFYAPDVNYLSTKGTL